jgi:hypothetical protein
MIINRNALANSVDLPPHQGIIHTFEKFIKELMIYVIDKRSIDSHVLDRNC